MSNDNKGQQQLNPNANGFTPHPPGLSQYPHYPPQIHPQQPSPNGKRKGGMPNQPNMMYMHPQQYMMPNGQFAPPPMGGFYHPDPAYYMYYPGGPAAAPTAPNGATSQPPVPAPPNGTTPEQPPMGYPPMFFPPPPPGFDPAFMQAPYPQPFMPNGPMLPDGSPAPPGQPPTQGNKNGQPPAGARPFMPFVPNQFHQPPGQPIFTTGLLSGPMISEQQIMMQQPQVVATQQHSQHPPTINKFTSKPSQIDGENDSTNMNGEGEYDDYYGDEDDDIDNQTPTSQTYSLSHMYKLSKAVTILQPTLENSYPKQSIISQVGQLDPQVSSNRQFYQAILASSPQLVNTLAFLQEHQFSQIFILNKLAADNLVQSQAQTAMSYEAIIDQGKSWHRRGILKLPKTSAEHERVEEDIPLSTVFGAFDDNDDDDDDGYGGSLFDGEKITEQYEMLEKQDRLRGDRTQQRESRPRITTNNRFPTNNKDQDGEQGGDRYLQLDEKSPQSQTSRQFRPREGLSRGNMGSFDPDQPQKPTQQPRKPRNPEDGQDSNNNINGVENATQSKREPRNNNGFLSRDMMGREDLSAPQPSSQRRGNNADGDRTERQPRESTNHKERQSRHVPSLRNTFAPAAPSDLQGQLKQNFQTLYNKLSISKFTEVSHDIAFQVMAYATIATIDKFKLANELCASLLYEHALLNPAFAYPYASLAATLDENLPPVLVNPKAPQNKPTSPGLFKAQLQFSIRDGLNNIINKAILDAQSIQHPHNPNAPLLTYVAEHDDDEKIRKQEKFIAWIQFFCETFNQGMISRDLMKELLFKLRFVTEQEFSALQDEPSDSDKTKDYNGAVDLKRTSFEALQAWHILLLHSGQTLERDLPQVASLMYKRCQWLSDHKPLAPLFRFKLRDILDYRRDGWKVQPVNRQRIDSKMTPESIKMYEVTDEVSTTGGHHSHQQHIDEKKKTIASSKAPTQQATSVLQNKVDSSGQVTTTQTSGQNIFSRFFKKPGVSASPAAAAPVTSSTNAAPATTNTTTVTSTTSTSLQPVVIQEDKVSTDKWLPNASVQTEALFNSQLVIDFCDISSERWAPIRGALRSSISDFAQSNDIAEINYIFAVIMAKPEYLALFEPYCVLPPITNPNQAHRRPTPPSTLAQAHLPVFFVITFILNCFRIRETYGLAQALNTIIYKYASLLQHDQTKNINPTINTQNITTQCSDMFVINWQHVILALTAGIFCNISDLAEEYPKVRELLPVLLGIWVSYRPKLEHGISTIPTPLAFTFVQVFTPLLMQSGPFIGAHASFTATFMETAFNVINAVENQQEPKAELQTPLSIEQSHIVYQKLILFQYSPIVPLRLSLMSQLDANAVFLNHSFSKNLRLLFTSNYAMDDIQPPLVLKNHPHSLPLPPVALQYAVCQFLMTFSIALISPTESTRRAKMTGEQFVEYEQLLNELLYRGFTKLAFGSEDSFLVRMYQALKASTPTTVPAEYQPFYEVLRTAGSASIPPHALLTQVLCKQLSAKPESSVTTQATIQTIISFAKLLAPLSK